MMGELQAFEELVFFGRIHTDEAFENLSRFITLFLNAGCTEKAHVEVLSSRDVAWNLSKSQGLGESTDEASIQSELFFDAEIPKRNDSRPF